MINNLYIRRIATTAFISLILISIGSVISAQATPKGVIPAHKIKEVEAVDKGYFIKEHGDIIGVFDGDGDLLYTVNVCTKTLPAADRMLLREGIAARDREELYEILGDYDS